MTENAVLKKTRLNQQKIDSNIIEGCRKGERKFQEKLYKYFYSYAFNISRLYTYSVEDAEEVMNESFLKLFNSFNKFDETRSLKTWIRTIIINTAIDNYRKNSRHFGLFNIIETKAQVDENDIISKLNFQEIIEALNTLPEVYRLTFNLYEIQGYSHKEIAKKLNISINSSRAYLMRAKNKLKIELTKNNSI